MNGTMPIFALKLEMEQIHRCVRLLHSRALLISAFNAFYSVWFFDELWRNLINLIADAYISFC